MELKDCLKKNIVGWLHTNEYYYDVNRRIYIYPRYIQKEDGSWEAISADVFPHLGALEVALPPDTYTAEELEEKVGSIVNVIINDYPIENTNKQNNFFKTQYNHNFGNNSKILIDKFDSSPFIQVVSCDKTFAELDRERKIVDIGDEIYTKEILIRCKDYYCGPFFFNPVSGVITLAGSGAYQHQIGTFEYSDIEGKLMSIDDNFDHPSAYFILKDIEYLQSVQKELYDWISDELLTNTLMRVLRKSSAGEYSIKDTQRIKDILLESLENKKDLELTDDRVDRLFVLLDNVDSQKQLLQEIAYKVLETPHLKSIITEVIVSDHFSQIEEKLTEFKVVKDKIDAMNKVLAELDIKKNEASKALSKKEMTQQQSELSKEIQTLQKEADKLKKLKIDIGIEFDTIDQLIAQKNLLAKDLKRIEKEINAAEKNRAVAVTALEKAMENFSNDEWLTETLVNHVMIEQVLSSVEGKPINPAPHKVYTFDTSLLKKKFDANSVINDLTAYVQEKASRDLPRNEVINLLICITQGFVTTFAGEPGTGKTSLCHILAKGLGLAREDQNNRFIEVPVERGWASHKDWIGYFNPLTNRPEKSIAEVYNALEQLNEEANTKDQAPFFFLLDEANLSQLEHYWAVFLRICDTDSCAKSSISLGGNISWNIPKSLRFLTTVNFDHTTEELSPRFLDRSWVITLSPDRITSCAQPASLPQIDSVYDFEGIQKAFSPEDGDEMDELCKEKWDAIQKIFRDENRTIMPRSAIMVQNYCAAACKLMDTKTSDTRLAPLDYAVSQKVLPTINGMGESYRRLTEKLLAECKNGMPLTYKHLERMARNAEETMGCYQFFSH